MWEIMVLHRVAAGLNEVTQQTFRTSLLHSSFSLNVSLIVVLAFEFCLMLPLEPVRLRY